MKNTTLTIFALIALTALGCRNDEPPAAATETISREAKLTQHGAHVKTEYVTTNYYFRLPNARGGEVDLKDYASKPTLVMFFTDNCPYCRKAAPFIKSLHEKYASKGLAVVGISVKTDPASAAGFAKDFNLRFDIAYNGGTVSRAYGIQGVPFIYLLDKDHERVKTWPGYDESYDEDMEKTIVENLN